MGSAPSSLSSPSILVQYAAKVLLERVIRSLVGHGASWCVVPIGCTVIGAG